MILGTSPLGSVPLAAVAVDGARVIAESIESGMDFTAGLVTQNIPHLIESSDMADVFSVFNTMQSAAEDTLGLSDAIIVVLRAIATDSMAMTSPLSLVLYKLEQIVETLVLSGVVTSQMQAMEQITEALLIEDLARVSFLSRATATGDFADAVHGRLLVIAGAISAANMSATVVPTLRITALVDDTLDAAVVLGTHKQMFEALAEGLVASMTISLGGVEYSAYVLSVNRRIQDGLPVAGVVEYQNFPFNSFAKWDSAYYGASEHGIFELTGDTDDGDEIAAWVRSAINNFGTGRAKRMPTTYIGYTSSGTMVLKVVTTANGAKVEDWYTLREKPATAMRDGRIKVGRGLSSVYWAWELHNVDGADFALDTIELMPLLLDRRIKDGN